jgi:hypothetical protein
VIGRRVETEKGTFLRLEKKSELVKTEENFTILRKCGRLPFRMKMSADVLYTNLL